MTKRMVYYESQKVLLILAELLCVAAAGYGVFRMIWYAIQYILSTFGSATLTNLVDGLPEKAAFAGRYLRMLITDLTGAEAISRLLRWSLFFGVSFGSLKLARYGMQQLEQSFRQLYMPEILEQTFSELSYEAKRRPAVEEDLCDMGLLNSSDRYYTANRLEGIYRGCWVASQEIICGGVYSDDYTSHKIKVRGQWLTVRLNVDFTSTVILESRGTANRFSHQGLSSSMVQLEPDHVQFAQRFLCYSDSPEEFQKLLTVEMAEKLLSMLELYPDLCVFFRRGCVNFLIRRRSFNRRWEPFCPFCYPQLKREVHRLYGPLMDFTDMLLE